MEANETGIAWDSVSNFFAKEPWQVRTDGEPGKAKYFYIGTVFNNYPSGKYYMPWCTNITEEEAEKDEEWQEAVEKKCSSMSWSFEHGEFDPCELFIVEYTDES